MRVVLDNITHNYQRPPSVGMPRHALRRRMPNSATGRPDLLGGRGVFPSRVCRAGRDPFSGPGHYFFTLKKNDTPESDFETHP